MTENIYLKALFYCILFEPHISYCRVMFELIKSRKNLESFADFSQHTLLNKFKTITFLWKKDTKRNI